MIEILKSIELDEPWSENRFPKICIDSDSEGFKIYTPAKGWTNVNLLYIDKVRGILTEEVVKVSFQDNGVFIISNLAKLSRACREYSKEFCFRVARKLKLYGVNYGIE